METGSTELEAIEDESEEGGFDTLITSNSLMPKYNYVDI